MASSFATCHSFRFSTSLSLSSRNFPRGNTSSSPSFPSARLSKSLPSSKTLTFALPSTTFLQPMKSSQSNNFLQSNHFLQNESNLKNESLTSTKALPKDGPSDPQDEGQDLTATLASVGIGCLWLSLAAYAFLLAPNQTPYQDRYFIEKLLFLHSDDGFILNPVLVSLFNLMGIWPVVYAMLLIPTARSSKGPPVWPFSVLSLFVGAFALLPYFALWRGDGSPPLPSKEEKEKLPIRILDSKITAAVLGFGALVLLANAFIGGEEAWKEFAQYFRGSRFIHVMSIDFLILCGMAPFWLYNDMTTREWEGRDSWWVPLSAVPLIGPIIHLLVRPKLP